MILLFVSLTSERTHRLFCTITSDLSVRTTQPEFQIYIADIICNIETLILKLIYIFTVTIRFLIRFNQGLF